MQIQALKLWLKITESENEKNVQWFQDLIFFWKGEIFRKNLKPTLSHNQDKFEILAQERDQAPLKKEISRLNRK